MKKMMYIRLAILTTLLFSLFSLTANAQSLNGNEAVSRLRQTGDYESLKFAFERARNNLFDEFSAPDTVIRKKKAK